MRKVPEGGRPQLVPAPHSEAGNASARRRAPTLEGTDCRGETSASWASGRGAITRHRHPSQQQRGAITRHRHAAARQPQGGCTRTSAEAEVRASRAAGCALTGRPGCGSSKGRQSAAESLDSQYPLSSPPHCAAEGGRENSMGAGRRGALEPTWPRFTTSGPAWGGNITLPL